MKESPPDAAEAEVHPGRVPGSKTGPDRFPVFPEGKNGLMGVGNHILWKSPNVTMADMANVLSFFAASEVRDRTGLKGKYEINMRWQQQPIEYFPNSPPFDGPTLEEALRDRLGLRLESKKGMGSVLVIDHVEKVPVEN
jgi:uncharacterized protein (TIGR03435 family)